MTGHEDLIKRLRGQLGPTVLPTYAELADLIERLQRDNAALMSDNAEQVRIASEAVRALIGLRNRSRVQGYALRRVIEHVEFGNPFDTACLDAVKRVCAELEGRGEQS